MCPRGIHAATVSAMMYKMENVLINCQLRKKIKRITSCRVGGGSGRYDSAQRLEAQLISDSKMSQIAGCNA